MPTPFAEPVKSFSPCEVLVCAAVTAPVIHQRQQQNPSGARECKILPFALNVQICRLQPFCACVKLTGKRIPSFVRPSLPLFKALLFASLALDFRLFPFPGWWLLSVSIVR